MKSFAAAIACVFAVAGVASGQEAAPTDHEVILKPWPVEVLLKDVVPARLPEELMSQELAGDEPAAPSPAAPVRTIPTVPINHPPGEATLKPWPVAAPDVSLRAVLPPAAQSGEPGPKLNLPVLKHPTWVWPPGNFWWAAAPGSMSTRRTWQAGWQPAVSETIKVASTTVLASTPRPALPTWVRAMSALTATDIAVPSWPRARALDFRLPMGRSRFAGEKILEPPARYARWTDRLETVLSDMREVNRRCLVMTHKPLPSGQVYRGCAHWVVGRCLITRVDDPGVARHEAAHCAGWPKDHPL